jgi:hypothetical protein
LKFDILRLAVVVNIHFGFSHKFVCHHFVHQLEGYERYLGAIQNLVYLFEKVSVKRYIIG